ncbi:MAG: Rpn family recombination-promoting nuclease/putative transposase [Candidatus Accumulibacter cognatus]|nr:MAG: Rpn family recombination-promoting nuclease/putative transposase [Candidatus Accumulibacter cognatus]
MANGHDSGYKFLFSTPELVRDLILGFVPDEWLHSLDYRTLEIVPGSYVSEDFRQRADDIVWRVRVGGEWVYLYLLIEFQQSTVGQAHGAAHDGLRGAALPGPDQAGPAPVRRPPAAGPADRSLQRRPALDRRDRRFPPDPADTGPGRAVQDPLLLPAGRRERLYRQPTGLAEEPHGGRLPHRTPGFPGSLGVLIALLEERLVDRPDLRRMFPIWIRATLMRKGEYRTLLPEIDVLQELKVMLAERLEEWAHGYGARGEEKRVAMALQRLLVRRFGVLPPDLASHIAAASREEIETWLDRVLDARSMEDVFGPTEH